MELAFLSKPPQIKLAFILIFVRISGTTMLTATVASPAAIGSGNWLRRDGISLSSGVSYGLPSSSRKFFPLTSTHCSIKKDVVHSFRSDSHIQGRDLMHSLVTKSKTDSGVDATAQVVENTDSSTEEKKAKKLRSGVYKGNKRQERNPKRLNSSAAKIKTDLTQVIKYPLRTEAAIKLMTDHNTLVFVVDKRADKNNIKESFETMLMIRARKVNTLMTPDGIKKAFVMLPSSSSAPDVAKKIKIL